MKINSILSFNSQGAILSCARTLRPAGLHCIQCKFWAATGLPQGKGQYFSLFLEEPLWGYSETIGLLGSAPPQLVHKSEQPGRLQAAWEQVQDPAQVTAHLRCLPPAFFPSSPGLLDFCTSLKRLAQTYPTRTGSSTWSQCNSLPTIYLHLHQYKTALYHFHNEVGLHCTLGLHPYLHVCRQVQKGKPHICLSRLLFLCCL